MIYANYYRHTYCKYLPVPNLPLEIVLTYVYIALCKIIQSRYLKCLTNQTITQIGEQNKDDAIKFLGIYIDRHLTWKKHINIICSKISKATFVINRVKHFLPHCALKSLYYTLIHSHMTYVRWPIRDMRYSLAFQTFSMNFT